MIILTDKLENHALLTVQKDILMDNARDFYLAVEEVFQTGGAEKCSLNFGQIRYIDSSGIGNLLKLANNLKKEGKILEVFNLNKTLGNVFKLAGLHSVLIIYTKEEFLNLYPGFKEVIS